MPDPCVVNITKRGGRRPAWDVYVGRGPCPCRARACSHGPTGWGNPYTVERDGPLAMVLYVDHLEQRLWAQPPFGQALDELDGKVLGCWCAPDPGARPTPATLTSSPSSRGCAASRRASTS
ncbi:MAG: DUF4326 domain-containing protein [Planctomycetes bacterium]|nr:DUF4326 domain-containing protein [Planctomycetota bacterium]